MKKFVWIVLILASCTKEKRIDPPTHLVNDQKLLVGTWHWTHSDHAYGWCLNDDYFEVIDTVSENINYQVNIQENGIAQFYKDDVLLKEKKIVFAYFQENEPDVFQFNIHLDGLPNDRLGGLGNDTSMQFYWFPFAEIPGCGYYSNFFVKE